MKNNEAAKVAARDDNTKNDYEIVMHIPEYTFKNSVLSLNAVITSI